MASSSIEEKIKDLLREANVKTNERNVRKIARIVDAMDREYKQKHRKPPGCLETLNTYSATLEESGHAPMRSDKYEGFSLSSDFCIKAKKKYNGRSEAIVTVVKNDFELKLVVVITYETNTDNYQVQFSNINLEIKASYTGVNQDPLDKIIFETCSYYEEFARQSDFTCGEYDIEKEVLAQLMPEPLSAKRARTS